MNLSLCTRCASISEKFQLTQKLLQQFSPKLIGSKLEFRACIDKDDSGSFSDHFELLDHIENALFPHCNLCHTYNFEVEFRFDSAGAAESVISSLLQMAPIRRCFNVKMLFYFVHSPTRLPMEGIVNWLTDNPNGNDSGKKKVLRIDASRIINAWAFFSILQVLDTL